MAGGSTALFVFMNVFLISSPCFAADPYVHYEFIVRYKSVSPLGVRQQVIAINDIFPGPVINATTNYNVVVNVRNELDEDFLLTWAGIQQRRVSWQDGVLGTNCPIPSKWNWTYEFQVKDQIGSFFYFPSLNYQRAAGGYGGFIINNREIISIPFSQPTSDIVILIGDWYNRNHTDLRGALDAGKEVGVPDGVLINGKGPYRYNDALVPSGIEYGTIEVEAGKTYRLRVHNVGTSTSLNFRIQSHNLLLVETEGFYLAQQNYTNLDVHVGQSYSFLLSTDQNGSSDYYVVASPRFVNKTRWEKVVTGVAILHYSNSKGEAEGELPPPPDDEYDRTFSMGQARSMRSNTTSSGARPNPQGSFRYGSINVSATYVVRNRGPEMIRGKLRGTVNGISFEQPSLPLRLSDMHSVRGVYKTDFPDVPVVGRPSRSDTSVINAEYKGFIEMVFQNNETQVRSYHMDGYAFFVVGMDYGEWSEASRGTYNRWDAVARSTIQVYPDAWTAVYVSLDNAGVWNLRVENLDAWYRGQETYVRVINPENSNKTEFSPPDNLLYCGPLNSLQKPQKISAGTPPPPTPLLLLLPFLLLTPLVLF